MKKLSKIKLHEAAVLNDSEMKMVLGGSGGIIESACNVGAKCTVYDPADGSTTTGTCQGQSSSENGSVSCYCDAYGVGSGSGNASGMSKCFKS